MQDPVARISKTPDISTIVEQAHAEIPELVSTLDDFPEHIIQSFMARQNKNQVTIPAIYRFALEQLRLAINDITRSTPYHRNHRENAREWIARRYTRGATACDVVSFDGVCGILGINAGWLAPQLLAIEGPRKKILSSRPRSTRRPKIRSREGA